ncbi:DMT family transporter [Paenibacillus elgii]
MNPFLLLTIAVLSEVFASSMLKLSYGFKKLFPSIGVIIGFGIAFYHLSLAIKSIPLGTTYAIWAGLGTALTALIGVVFYKENFNVKKLLGLVLIIGGVVTLQLSTSGTH